MSYINSTFKKQGLLNSTSTNLEPTIHKKVPVRSDLDISAQHGYSPTSVVWITR